MKHISNSKTYTYGLIITSDRLETTNIKNAIQLLLEHLNGHSPVIVIRVKIVR